MSIHYGDHGVPSPVADLEGRFLAHREGSEVADRRHDVPAKLAYTVEEAVAASGISRSRLYEHHAAGVITMRKAGRRTLIMGDELRGLIEGLPAAPRKAA